jgi:hypothetical protein
MAKVYHILNSYRDGATVAVQFDAGAKAQQELVG